MISEIEISQLSFAAEIHRLAQSAYAVEAETLACTAFPPLDESLEELQRSGDRFLAARENGSIIGALSFARSATNRLVITRLIVSPSHFRRGIGKALLVHLEREHPHIIEFIVFTAAANFPAVNLYHRFGFAVTGLTESSEGIPLVHLAKVKYWNAMGR